MSTGTWWLVGLAVVGTLCVVWLVHNWMAHRQKVLDDAAVVTSAFDKAKTAVSDAINKVK